jgi:hypothetical protein
VIAFEQDLVAAADAHQLMAEFVETGGGICRAGEDENGCGEHRAVEDAAEGRIEISDHWLVGVVALSG